ncbi:N-acylethanolamine-hydrolyzing acid amidase-like [Gastrophryne carolinensis]
MMEEKDYPAPRYNISLDLPPEKRWEAILQDKNATELHEYMDTMFRMIDGKWTKSYLSLMADFYLDFIAPDQYAGEMRGIAKALGLKKSEVVLVNLLYELVMACTSIIAEDNEGYIHHGRNMDMMYPNVLRKITLDVNFIRNGQIVYTGSTFVGFVGLYTGQRPHKFSISANAREHNQHLWKNVVYLLLSSSPISWLIRNTLDSAPDYESAVAQLSNTHISSEIYLTIAGTRPGEGVAITRDRDGLADILHLNVSDGRWFLIQTNYDRGDFQYDRRILAAVEIAGWPFDVKLRRYEDVEGKYFPQWLAKAIATRLSWLSSSSMPSENKLVQAASHYEKRLREFYVFSIKSLILEYPESSATFPLSLGSIHLACKKLVSKMLLANVLGKISGTTK